MQYSDAALDYYADRFMALRMARHGITLLQYLANPAKCEQLALEPEPPLPAQHAAILRIWHRWDTGLGARPATAEECGIDTRDFIDPSELVAQWRAEAEQAEMALDHLPQRNGAAFEPLTHHRHNRGSSRGNANFMTRKRGA